MLEGIERRFRALAPAGDFVSLRVVHRRYEGLLVRRGIVQPPQNSDDLGAMCTVVQGGGVGYAATPDLSETGLREAIATAQEWAERSAALGAAADSTPYAEPVRGEYRSPVRQPWSSVPIRDKLDRLRGHCERLAAPPEIVDCSAGIWHGEEESLLLAANGTRVHQQIEFLLPTLSATTHRRGLAQTRTFGGHAQARQGGLELLEETGFESAAPRIAAQAVELLHAPNCPSGRTELLLAPDQMILQIHESIGHPLELDRILGDERNYAGTSFVTLEMFGHYRYGSELLNVSFDPLRAGELASYAFDDEGLPASRADLIRAGLLLRPLGGWTSQRRAGTPGVANARASSWNRPPIDRMANLNLEPGDTSFEAMVAAIEHGVYMETNCSWSIDDSRNGFQFGCEWARLIEDGKLGPVVRNPNYRGTSARFWRSLTAVGNAETVEVLGTPYCGKGEPNQAIRVGHASPACVFSDVDVFGGE